MNKYFACFGLPGAFVLSMLMSLFALALALLSPTPARWFCFAAMALSSVGDTFLTNFKGIKNIFPNYFTIGAAFFMAAHLLYIASYGIKIRNSGAAFFNGGVILVLAAAIALYVYFIHLSISTGHKSVLPLVVVYLAIISADCMTIFSYAWSQGFSNPLAILAAVGAVSFMISDLIIGLGIAGGITKYDSLIWWYYPIGQILMIAGVGR